VAQRKPTQVWVIVTMLLGSSIALVTGCEDGGGDGEGDVAGAGADSPLAGEGGGRPSSAAAGAGGTMAAAGGVAGEGAAAGENQGTAGGDGSSAGATGAGGTSGGAGEDQGGHAGIGGAGEGCVQHQLFGTYRLQLHNEVRVCSKDDFSCAPPHLIEAETVTFTLHGVREAAEMVQGAFHGPGITLGEGRGDVEIWDFNSYIYYPEAGDEVDIWSESFPPGSVGGWDPSRAGEWVRFVIDDLCPTEDAPGGFVHIDIELATGRVLDFARACDADYSTVWEEYRQRGTGELACDLNVCHELENDAPAAQIVEDVAAQPLTSGAITSGTYHLTSVEYDPPPGCVYALPDEIRETIEVLATSSTAGTMQVVRQLSPELPMRSTHSYQTPQGLAFLNTKHVCGGEALTMQLIGSIHYEASATGIKMRYPTSGCDGDPSTLGTVTYVYQKQ
jgi:hypothetical protein